MAKYLIEANYTTEGVRGLLKDGGTKRRDVVKKLVKSVGGKVEAFYFCFGETDAVVIVDLPDSTTAASVSLNVAATGAVKLATVSLLSPEDIDAAAKKKFAYKAPGTT